MYSITCHSWRYEFIETANQQKFKLMFALISQYLLSNKILSLTCVNNSLGQDCSKLRHDIIVFVAYNLRVKASIVGNL